MSTPALLIAVAVSSSTVMSITRSGKRPVHHSHYYRPRTFVEFVGRRQYLEVITRLFSYRPVYQAWASISALGGNEGRYSLIYGRYENSRIDIRIQFVSLTASKFLKIVYVMSLESRRVGIWMSSLVNLVCLNCRRGGCYEMQYIPCSLVTASELWTVDCHVWCFRTISFLDMSMIIFFLFSVAVTTHNQTPIFCIVSRVDKRYLSCDRSRLKRQANYLKYAESNLLNDRSTNYTRLFGICWGLCSVQQQQAQVYRPCGKRLIRADIARSNDKAFYLSYHQHQDFPCKIPAVYHPVSWSPQQQK